MTSTRHRQSHTTACNKMVKSNIEGIQSIPGFPLLASQIRYIRFLRNLCECVIRYAHNDTTWRRGKTRPDLWISRNEKLSSIMVFAKNWRYLFKLKISKHISLLDWMSFVVVYVTSPGNLWSPWWVEYTYESSANGFFPKKISYLIFIAYVYVVCMFYHPKMLFFQHLFRLNSNTNTTIQEGCYLSQVDDGKFHHLIKIHS